MNVVCDNFITCLSLPSESQPPSFSVLSIPMPSPKMRITAYAALLLGLASAALGQVVTLAPSPTESVGCTPHGDHWHCDGPRVTSAVTSTSTTSTVASHHDDDHDHEHEEEDDHDHEEDTGSSHTDSPHTGTASLKPSPTESYGCEAHGDHWHCKGPVTASSASGSGAGVSTSATTTARPSVSTGAAPRHQAVAGLGVAGVVVVAAMAGF